MLEGGKRPLERRFAACSENEIIHVAFVNDMGTGIILPTLIRTELSGVIIYTDFYKTRKGLQRP